MTAHPTITTRCAVLAAWATVILAILVAGREIVKVWVG